MRGPCQTAYDDEQGSSGLIFCWQGEQHQVSMSTGLYLPCALLG